MSSPCPYALSDIPSIAALQQRWLADRARRRRVPPERSWRGCLGLAMLLDRPDDTEYDAGRALLPNDHVRWLALRDVPPGHFPGSGPMHRRGVSYANVARATLRYGMPSIDFSQPDRDAVDFRFVPGPRRYDVGRHFLTSSPTTGDVLDAEARTRELEVLVRLSEAMTRVGLPHRAGGGGRRKQADPRARPRVRCADAAEGWMPVPYLAFMRKDAAALIDRLVRQPPFCARNRFCDALALGLPLVAHADATYLGEGAAAGPRPRPAASDHLLRLSGKAGRVHSSRIPRSAEPLVGVGQEVEARRPWCRLVPRPPAAWRRCHPAEQWRTLRDVLPADASLPLLLRLWLEDQLAVPSTRPDLRLIPAALAAMVAGPFVPAGLWWDLSPTDVYLDGILKAAVFPPIPTAVWDALRLALPGEVELDAAVGDPRFDIGRRGEARRLPGPVSHAAAGRHAA